MTIYAIDTKYYDWCNWKLKKWRKRLAISGIPASQQENVKGKGKVL